MVVFVNCNDVFEWRVTESEEIASQADLKRLIAHRRRDPVYGALKWACQTRNEQPQAPWVREMKEAGAWTELMANLPANACDRIRSGAAK